MKRVLSAILAVALMLSIAACGKRPAPDKVIDETLEALQTLDRDTILEIYNLSGEAEPLSDEELNEVMAVLELLLGNMSYTMGETVVDEKAGTATVNVSITNTDMSDLLARYMTAALEYAFKYAFLPAEQQPTDEEVTQAMYDMLKEMIASPDNKTVTITVDVPMVLENDEWVVQDSLLFSDAIFGGMITAMEDLNEQMSAMQ